MGTVGSQVKLHHVIMINETDCLYLSPNRHFFTYTLFFLWCRTAWERDTGLAVWERDTGLAVCMGDTLQKSVRYYCTIIIGVGQHGRETLALQSAMGDTLQKSVRYYCTIIVGVGQHGRGILALQSAWVTHCRNL